MKEKKTTLKSRKVTFLPASSEAAEVDDEYCPICLWAKMRKKTTAVNYKRTTDFSQFRCIHYVILLVALTSQCPAIFKCNGTYHVIVE